MNRMKMHYSISVVLIILFLSSCSAVKQSSKNFDYTDDHFSKYVYTLHWQSNDPAFDINLKKQFIETFFTVYPKLAKDFNRATSKKVYFIVDTSFNQYPAATWGDTVKYSSAWFKKYPKDIDVVTHEVMHIIQQGTQYTNDNWWMVEGIADYVRYKYGVANAEGGWSLPAVSASQKFDNGYRVTARFLAWCENKKQGSVKTFDNALRTNTYNSNLWNTLFGKSVDELWSEYVASPAI